MPEEWRAGPYGSDDGRLARRVADYIAGMTDNYALQEHRRLFGVTPELR
jgi:dGTPase